MIPSNLITGAFLLLFFADFLLAAPPSDMVTVAGGTLPASSELGAVKVSSFNVSKHEVTWGEWKKVADWAAGNGYDMGALGIGNADDHPSTPGNWYSVLKWCNAKSEMEGLAPVYKVTGNTYKAGERVPSISVGANGYRLPSEAEWAWAARGGISSKGYAYSGSNKIDEVGWYDGNSSGGLMPVAKKAANEIGLYDMSGNVWEWCWDPVEGSANRRIRGGSCASSADFCTVSARLGGTPSDNSSGIGFRTAKDSPK